MPLIFETLKFFEQSKNAIKFFLLIPFFENSQKNKGFWYTNTYIVLYSHYIKIYYSVAKSLYSCVKQKKALEKNQ